MLKVGMYLIAIMVSSDQDEMLVEFPLGTYDSLAECQISIVELNPKALAKKIAQLEEDGWEVLSQEIDCY